MAAVIGPVKHESPIKCGAKKLARNVRAQPLNKVPGSFYNGGLTFKVNAREKTVWVSWQIIADGTKNSEGWVVVGGIIGFLVGAIFGGPIGAIASEEAAAGVIAAGALKGGLKGACVGGIAGLSAKTMVHIYKVNALDRKVDDMRITAGRICRLIVAERAEKGGAKGEALLDGVSQELMIEPIDLGCAQGLSPHVFDLETISEIMVREGDKAKCPLCRATLKQEDFTYRLETKQAIQGVVTEALQHLRKISLSDPKVIDRAYREKDNPELLSRAKQIVKQNMAESLDGMQAYVLASVIEKYAESWNNRMEELHKGLMKALSEKRDQKEISREQHVKKTQEALDWYRASLIN